MVFAPTPLAKCQKVTGTVHHLPSRTMVGLATVRLFAGCPEWDRNDNNRYTTPTRTGFLIDIFSFFLSISFVLPAPTLSSNAKQSKDQVDDGYEGARNSLVELRLPVRARMPPLSNFPTNSLASIFLTLTLRWTWKREKEKTAFRTPLLNMHTDITRFF